MYRDITKEFSSFPGFFGHTNVIAGIIYWTRSIILAYYYSLGYCSIWSQNFCPIAKVYPDRTKIQNIRLLWVIYGIKSLKII